MRITLLLSILLISINSYSQDTLAIIPDTNIKNLYGQPLGDSVVLFSEIEGGRLIGSIINPTGSYFNIALPELEKKVFCAAVNSQPSIDFYFFDKKDENNLNTLRYDKSTKTKTLLSSSFKLSGNFLGSALANKDLYLFYLLPDEIIKITQIRAGKINNEASFKLSLPFSHYREVGVSIISEGTMVTPYQAESQIKIYIGTQTFIISLEFTNGVKIMKLDFNTGEIENYSIMRDWGRDYGTFITNDTLYAVTRIDNKYFEVKAFTILDGHEFHSFQINTESPFKSELSFLRDERTKVVLNNKSVWDAMDNIGRPFICTYQMEDGTTTLKLGTHRNITINTMPTVMGLILPKMIGLGVGQFFTQYKSLDLYFFLKGSTDTGFKYYNELQLIEQRIDIYESYDGNEKKKTKYSFKEYIHAPGKTYSIYKTIKDPYNFEIVTF